MALLEILTYPDPRLAQKAEPVQEVTDETRKLVEDMLETMYEADGVGLAAPQVGVLQRIIVVDCNEREDADGNPLPRNPTTIINPEIVTKSEERIIWEEGCLSVPEYTDEVERSQTCTVSGLDATGQAITIEADGLLSVCLQHEIDHLEGVLFVDHLSRLKQSMVKKKLKRRAAEHVLA